MEYRRALGHYYKVQVFKLWAQKQEDNIAPKAYNIFSIKS